MLTVYSFLAPALIPEKGEEGAQVLKEQTRIHSSYSVELGSARIWVEETFLFGWEIAVWLECNWTFEKSKNSKAIGKLWDWPRYFQGVREQGLTGRFRTAVVGGKEIRSLLTVPPSVQSIQLMVTTLAFGFLILNVVHQLWKDVVKNRDNTMFHDLVR